MGSRTVALVHRRQRDGGGGTGGCGDGTAGALHTRTGRAVFDAGPTRQFLARLGTALEVAGVWDLLGASWVLLDAELLPWSVKAADLLQGQYAAIGAAANAALAAAVEHLEAAAGRRGLDVADLLARTRGRQANAEAFRVAYRPYAWATDGLDGVQIAPFQVLASDGATYETRDHLWHLDIADRLVAAYPVLLRRTRGREYLRIIYGPDYTQEHHLPRLRQRNLRHKRSLALREYALGLEALSRAAKGEPLAGSRSCLRRFGDGIRTCRPAVVEPAIRGAYGVLAAYCDRQFATRHLPD